MENTTITIRTDKELKEQASTLFESLGMTLSAAINMFMKQAVMKQRYPCSLELDVAEGFEISYPKGFFELFGSGKDLGLDTEPEELAWEMDTERMTL